MKSQQASTIANLSGLYDEDFFEWAGRNAELLRAGQLEQADIEHIAEEIEDMGKRDLKELNSRLQVLLMHLLKWQLQPERRSRSWERTIINQRIKLETLLEQSPSLRSKSLDYLESHSQCPFTLTQILDREFLP